MGKISRRRIAITSATVALSSAALGAVGSFTSSPSLDASSSPETMSSSSDTGSSISISTTAPASTIHPLSTAFSCGSHWRHSQTCSTLCPTGQDSACPLGQYCHAGIPCSQSLQEPSSGEEGYIMEGVLKRQARMEQREMNRLKTARIKEYVDRFVCGESYAAAAESCGGNVAASSSSSSITDDNGGSLPTAAAALQYCPTGSSSQCPTGMECYAAVSCSRPSHDEKVSLVENVSVRLLDSLMTTAAAHEGPASAVSSLPNSTTAASDDDGDNGVLIEEGVHCSSSSSLIDEWRIFFQESSSSSSIVSRTVSAMLPSSYSGLN
mmetsp:Transcript_30866/g.65243  ORF Transcript_30866/g.65243 Transcript_30866/m.65243 type:complete len:323 (-) Transcript_30866:123-1091(-)|eukprot:CAMPEP_0172316178 /NCGR_PEP_ID=MMETSP1058-20130122/27496_1 /TAXON_ID=83371 /ORGANISM="Detonula confervacea, Strain CCMP 353" /LENGTH=322 /DNA_ID=CAMNT_0013030435 /DNA_START=646 /DNA_END=1614 /DNA_ORIENTATION=+